ncbi:MAG: hypothetical protein U0175_05400 [Caldilineaceae bacterium]
MENTPWSKIDRQLVGEPQIVGQTTIQLTAHAHGWQIQSKDRTAPLTGAFVRLRPVSAQVRSERGEETVEFVDPVNAALRAMLGVALLISAVCWIIMRITIGIAGRSKRALKRR